jgi:NAD(P)-dependent dehydrogenase (short-subunit alcohol dehydrogenase family)
MNLKGKVVVVTGVANPRGIGLALATAYALNGAKIVLADISAEGAESSAEKLRGQGAECIAVPVNMSVISEVRELADSAYESFGRVDLLFLNHASMAPLLGHSLLAPEVDSWDNQIDVNLKGVIYGIKSFLPRMMASGNESYISATVSGAGINGLMYGNAPYAVSKVAITAVMESLYGQLRDADSAVRCGVIVPGFVATMATDDIAKQGQAMLNAHGFPASIRTSAQLAEFTMAAIERGDFWAHPSLEEDQRLTGGEHQDQIKWVNEIYQKKADALKTRSNPDSYLWGPPSLGT